MSEEVSQSIGDAQALSETQAALKVALAELDGHRAANRQAVASLASLESQLAAAHEALTLVEQERDQATFKAMILEAQLGGLVAQCAAEVTAAQGYLDALLHTGHTGAQLAARGRLANAIDSNVGQLLLQKLEAQEAELTRLRHSYASADATLQQALERNGYLERQNQLLHSAARPAAALLTELDQTGSVDQQGVAAARVSLESVLAASGNGPT